MAKSNSQKGEKPEEYGPNLYILLDAGDIKVNKLTISAPKAPSLEMKTNMYKNNCDIM